MRIATELELESWSVISERGREASGLNYEEARRLVHKLASESRHGLCIITDKAASALTAAHEFAAEQDLTARS